MGKAMSTQPPPDQPTRAFKIAFAISVITLILTLWIVLIAGSHFASLPRGGLGGYAVIHYAKIYVPLIFLFALISLATGIFAAIGFPPARRYMAGVLTFVAVCVIFYLVSQL
jgi:hypothetical protein